MRPRAICAAAAAAACLAIGASADRAIVVGVQRYPDLPRANTLRGCVNDARAIQATLEARGFAVTLLTNEQATRQAVLDAIRAAAAAIRPEERFVFYFAGHGRDIPQPGLMPSDATDSGSSSITPEDLYQAVTAVRAGARTVILDSCFSGAMSRALGGPDFRARYYAPEGSKSITPRPANGQDTQKMLQKVPEICYWTASQGNQQAIEGRFQGQYHGVFTKEALDVLPKGKDASWGQVNGEVKGKMAETLGDKFHQSPTITPAFVDAPLFDANKPAEGAGPAANAAPPAAVALAPTLWDQFNTDRVDPAMVALAVSPDKTAFEIGDELAFKTTVGADGYLVILERDVDDKVYLLFPETPSADSAAVRAGQTIRFPADLTKVVKPEDKGIEHVKAILLGARDQVEAVLGALPKSGDGVRFGTMKKLRVAPASKAPLFTSEVTISVVGKGEAAR